MSHTCAKTTATILAALAVALLFLSASSVRAQARSQPPRDSTPQRALPPYDSSPLSVRQQMQLESNQRLGPPAMDQGIWFESSREREWRVVAAEIKKDAESLQFFNSEMSRTVSPGAALDYKAISKATGEIKKRAARLMLNLRFERDTQAEKSQKELPNDKELAASLVKLDGLVRSFSANPLPRQSNKGVLDVRQMTDAARDLQDIILLSDQIRKSAKKLNQAARKSR